MPFLVFSSSIWLCKCIRTTILTDLLSTIVYRSYNNEYTLDVAYLSRLFGLFEILREFKHKKGPSLIRWAKMGSLFYTLRVAITFLYDLNNLLFDSSTANS